MTIGLPRAMLYFKYQYLWETFFKELGCNVVVSAETNKKILANGINYSIDECCLPSKIYMGHIYSLIGKCDYILVPRVDNFKRKEKVCVKFNAMYDIVKNTFKDVSLINYNIDVINGKRELNGFIQMGKLLGKSYKDSLISYNKAKKVQMIKERQNANEQLKLLNKNDRLKILIVTHPYNVYDKLMGYPIVEYIKKLDGTPIFANCCDSRESIRKSKETSKYLYWTYNKELVGAVELYKDKVDGIILLTAFPCGPDSLVNELLIRKTKKTPTVNIILDELQGEAGLQTRMESFMDIIKERRKVKNG